MRPNKPSRRRDRNSRLWQLHHAPVRAYDGRNPRTGAIVQVKPKRLAFFKVGRELRERVSDGGKGNDKQLDKDRAPKRALSS
jgi:hypothetical protein